MTESDHDIKDAREPGRERDAFFPLAVGVAVIGVCCGLPMLGSIGAAGLIAGLGAGSWLAAAIASFAVFVGVRQWRRSRSCRSCPVPDRAGTATETVPSSRS
jgi:hypothetical protein